jgi:hypothetical protein
MYASPHAVMKIKTVKPEKAIGIENSIINAARNGMIKNRVTEAELVSLLEKDIANRGEQKVTVIEWLCSSSAEESMISIDPHQLLINSLSWQWLFDDQMRIELMLG